MNPHFIRPVRLLIFTLAALLAPAAFADPAETPSAAVDVSGRIWIEGDSSLHKYKLDALSYSAVVRPAPEANGTVDTWLQDGRVRSITLTIPVARLSSGESGLDDNMRKTLHAKEHPEIVFEVDKITPGAHADHVKLEGVLEIAGVKRPEAIDTAVTRGQGTLRLQGQKQLKMTDYKVKPPVFMGFLKTADEIVIHFDIVVR